MLSFANALHLTQCRMCKLSWRAHPSLSWAGCLAGSWRPPMPQQVGLHPQPLAVFGWGKLALPLQAAGSMQSIPHLTAHTPCPLYCPFPPDIFVMPSESETLGNVVGEVRCSACVCLHQSSPAVAAAAAQLRTLACQGRPCIQGSPAPLPYRSTQAMASGLPVVAAAAGGVPSVMGRPGTTGVLFPPGDAAAAAAAVRRLAADASARRRMGRAARAEMERCSWRAATRELLRQHYPAALAAWRQQEGGAWALARQAAA